MKNLCLIRELYRSINDFETNFQETHRIGLNEAMTLCSLQGKKLSSGEIAETMGLSCSNTSKIIRSLEDKELIERILGKEDKRQMYFQLTPAGDKLLKTIGCTEIDMPDILKSIVH